MSFGDYECPAGVLEQPAAEDCPFNMWQIVKLWFYKDGASPFSSTTGLDSPDNATAVTALFGAVDDTKLISTPNFIEGLEIPAPELITEGGGSNATPFGREIVTGVNPIVVNSPMIREISPAGVRTLKKLNGIPKIRMFMINEFGKVIGSEDGSGGVEGFLVSSLTFRDPQRLGKNTNDKMPFSFNLDYGWSDNAVVIEPTDYDALTDY